jgi:hypothetical protein
VHASRAAGKDDHLSALAGTTDVQGHSVRRGNSQLIHIHNSAGKEVEPPTFRRQPGKPLKAASRAKVSVMFSGMVPSSRLVSRQPTGAKRWIVIILRVLVAAAMLICFPAMIVFGVIDIEHADQIEAGGVAVTGTVVSDQQDYSQNAAYPCIGATVSYTTVGGIPEQANLVQDGNCLSAGSTVRVVYDPKAPNVIQPVSDRGSTTGGWGGVIMGSLFTIPVWGVFIWSLLSRKRRGGRGKRRINRHRTPRTSRPSTHSNRLVWSERRFPARHDWTPDNNHQQVLDGPRRQDLSQDE